MWGRFSGSTESYIDQDLAALESGPNPLDQLLEQLRLWHGGLRTEADNFMGSSLGARFYPVLYMLTRMGDARDLCSGLPLKSGLLGKMSQLEVHHIFPKAQLYKQGHGRETVNALANFCFLTKECNLDISDRLPEEYFPQVEADHPGVLESQWIPTDPALWEMDRYVDFLAARRDLLANETNRRMQDLLHGDKRWLAGAARETTEPAIVIPGAVASGDEESELEAINQWVKAQGLSIGKIAFGYTDSISGDQLAVFDLAWPEGLQQGLSQPVAVLLNEGIATLAAAASAGYRCFTNAKQFYQYVEAEILPVGAGA